MIVMFWNAGRETALKLWSIPMVLLFANYQERRRLFCGIAQQCQLCFPNWTLKQTATVIDRTMSEVVPQMIRRICDHSLVIALPGPDYFDEEAKCYGRLFEFCQVTFCHSRQWGRVSLAKF